MKFEDKRASSRLLLDPDVKRHRVRLLVTIVLVGTVAAIAYHYVVGFYFGIGYPRSVFLFTPGDHFNDWDNPYLYAKAFLRGDPSPFIYFPFAFFAFTAATLLPMRLGFALVIGAFLIALGWMLWGWVVDAEEHLLVRVQYAFILVVLSYPVIFAIDRTNPELLLFVFVGAFFYFLYKRESPWLAALMLAMAIAFKLYPATLLLLLLAERRFSVLVRTVILAFGFTVLGTLLLTVVGHRSLIELWQMNSNEKTVYQQIMVIQGDGLQHGHSLWGLLRLPGFIHQATVLGWHTTLYSVVAAFIFLLLALHVVFRETERWKRVLLCVVPALLLPFVSADYTLIWMYFPLVFFLNAPRVSGWDVLYTVLFGVLLVPVDYYYLSTNHYGVSISVVVYPLAMLMLIAVAVFEQRGRKQRLDVRQC